MEDELRIVPIGEPQQPVADALSAGLDAYNAQHAPVEPHQHLCFALQTADGELVGGVRGGISWTWLHVDDLWVREDFRGRGYGSRLLAAVEEAARHLGMQQVHLETLSFQAPEFYKRHGYQVFGELDEFAGKASLFFLRKRL